MSKEKKTAPAAPGNPAVRTWPTEVNDCGVIIGSPVIIEAKEKKKYVKVTAAFVVEAGKIGVALGLDYKSSDGMGGGGHATSVTGTIHSTPKDALEKIGDYFKRAQIPFALGTASDDFANGLTQVTDVPAQVEALGVSEDELMAWLETGKQPGEELPVAEEQKPRVLGRNTQQVRVDYTDAQTIEHSRKLAATHKAIADIEARKQRANQQFKMELEAQSDLIEDYSGRIREGYFMKEQPCTTYADMPVKGRKSIVRDDTGEVIAEFAMNHGDFQAELPLGDKQKSEVVKPAEEEPESDDGDEEPAADPTDY